MLINNTEGGGYLVLGGVDEGMYTGDIHWFKYTTYNFYSLNVKRMAIGNVKLGINLKAVLDTKYEYIIVDGTILQEIKREVQSSLCRSGSQYLSNSGLCSEYGNIMDGYPVKINLHKSQSINDIFPVITLHTETNKVKLQISDYILPCDELNTFKAQDIPNDDLENYYCTIIRPFMNYNPVDDADKELKGVSIFIKLNTKISYRLVSQV